MAERTCIDTFFAYRTPHGLLTIGTRDDCIASISFGDCERSGKRIPTELSNRAATELLEYFAGKRREFDLPIAPEGTTFQQAVWHELAHIPYGCARTSTEVAKALGCPSSYKAVGSAVRQNPIEVLIPSHRIVNAQGKPLGNNRKALVRYALLKQERSRQ